MEIGLSHLRLLQWTSVMSVGEAVRERNIDRERKCGDLEYPVKSLSKSTNLGSLAGKRKVKLYLVIGQHDLVEMDRLNCSIAFGL